jgi:hypothetical protein
MRLGVISLSVGVLVATACTSPPPEPQVDASGLVRVTSWKAGGLFAHPQRSIDDYDDILIGDVGFSYAPNQKPLTRDQELRVRSMVYSAVVRQIPAAGQLAASKAGPCTVELGVQLSRLELPEVGSRSNGAATVSLAFADSVTGDSIVHYEQHRELSVGAPPEGGGPDLDRLGATLEVVAEDVRLRLRDTLPLGGTGARANQGCKGTIGAVRKQTKLRQAGNR